MLKTLRIQNFKGWKDTDVIKFAPITLFLGGNSSGKSSIGQFLLFLKQSCLSPDRKSVFFFGDENSDVEFGSQRDIIYQNDLNNKLRFEYSWIPKSSIAFEDSVNKIKYNPNEMKFMSCVNVNEKGNAVILVEEFKYIFNDLEGKEVILGMERMDAEKVYLARTGKSIAKNYTLIRTSGRPWQMPAPFKFYGFPDEMISYHQNATFASILNFAQVDLLSSISYLGPIRKEAKRFYRWTGATPESVGKDGRDTIQAILAAGAENRKLNFRPKQGLVPFEGVIAQMMKDMGLIDDLSISKIGESSQRQEYDVKVKTKGSGTFVDIPDVGFGVSQVLPVLVQIFYAPPNSIVIIEQPELHLHPKAQSELADVIIKAIRARENATERNVQIIIETHSEHFLRRFQRRIAEKELDNADFIAYFANCEATPPSLDLLQVNLYGEIANWPKNFFGDKDGDMYLQTEAALKRRMNGE